MTTIIVRKGGPQGPAGGVGDVSDEMLQAYFSDNPVTLDPDQIATAVNDYLTENPASGVTPEQLAAAIQTYLTAHPPAAGANGTNGSNGAAGAKGWSPVFALVFDNPDDESRAYLKLTDWVGGTGTKPTQLGYVNETGLTSDVQQAIYVNGLDGQDGDSAYGVAVQNGFEGTVEEWLESLHGEDGTGGGSPTLGANLTAIDAMDVATPGTIATDGSGFIRKTYTQLKASLGLTKADVGLNNVDNTTDLAKPLSTATVNALALKLNATLLGAANGAAQLDASGFLLTSQMPSYVDDVLEFANLAAFPSPGNSGKIYVTLDTNMTYRWGGSAYVLISDTIALGETSSTAYRGDRGKIAYDHSQDVATNPHNVTKSQVGLANVNNTSDTAKPVSSAQQTALDLKADLSLKGAPFGLAELDGANKLKSSQIPEETKDIYEYANFAAFPGTGYAAKLYVALDTGRKYRWNAGTSAYVGDPISAAVQTALDALDPSAPKKFEGVPAFYYGHSFVNVPGVSSSKLGGEWVRRLTQRFGFSPVAENGVSGTFMGDIAGFAIGTAKPMTVPTDGIVFLEAMTNEMLFNANTANANFQAGFANTMRAFIANATAASRVDATTGTAVGTWTTIADIGSTAGSLRQSSTLAATLTWSGIVAPLGYVWLLAYAQDLTATVGTFGIEVDGVDQGVSFTGLGLMKNYTGYNISGTPTARSYLPHVIKVMVPNTGSHSIKIKKTDAVTTSAGNVNIDSLLLPSPTPPRVVVLKDPGNNSTSTATVGGTMAAAYATYAPIYRALIDSIVAEFGSGVFSIDLNDGWDAATMCSSTDTYNVHPNDLGMSFIATKVGAALKTNIPNTFVTGVQYL